MSDLLEHTERAPLRSGAHLVPPKCRRVVEVLDALVPATPKQTMLAPSDPGAGRLGQVAAGDS
jgi:hypothetical protein